MSSDPVFPSSPASVTSRTSTSTTQSNFLEKPRHVIGVCALEAKSRSKPMRNILDRILASNVNASNPFHFEICLFTEQMILNEPQEQWPVCDSLIAFYSAGFPLEKAIAYQRRLEVFCINDLTLQALLQDRRLTHLILEAIDVPTPKRLWFNSPADTPPKQVTAALAELVSRDFNVDISAADLYSLQRLSTSQTDGSVRVGALRLARPFIEKPANADDHNIYIYHADREGVTRLFRKVANKSSEFLPGPQDVRGLEPDAASYVYEDFLPVDGTEDVKVYTVGPNYAYAETRKSPFVDGVVVRNAQGKEVRTPTILTDEEQEIARRVAMAFGQTVCGFDLVRSEGRPYVLDVNGWSFVKGSDVYYDKAAKILRETLIQVARRKRKISLRTQGIPLLATSVDEFTGQWRLKAYVAVFRHADRTPKQKLKVYTCCTAVLALFKGLAKAGDRELLIKGQQGLEALLKLCIEADDRKLTALIEALQRKLRVPGTKAQLRLVDCSEEGEPMLLLVILKWGGEFTHAGRHQSKDVAENLRKDLLILNKRVLEDVRVSASAERRVQATAQVFMKALLPLAELPDNLVVPRPDMLDDRLLDKQISDCIKAEVAERFKDSELVAEIVRDLRRHREVFRSQARELRTPSERWCCSESPALFIERWEKHFRDVLDVANGGDSAGIVDLARFNDLYDSIRYDAIHHRAFLLHMFVGGGSLTMRIEEALEKDPSERIFFATDARNDSLFSVAESHNESSATITTEQLESHVDLMTSFKRLFANLHVLGHQLRPLELGCSSAERAAVSEQIAGNLLAKIVQDMREAQLGEPCTRLYFTKETQMMALMALLQARALPSEAEERPYFQGEYLSQVCFEFYEKRRAAGEPAAYSLRIGVSPGANDPHLFQLQLDAKHAVRVAGREWITAYLEGNRLLSQLEQSNNPRQ
jgi:inositol hexakisphosphate/diphosphoinositol-pentakisphosphate kinase